MVGAVKLLWFCATWGGHVGTAAAGLRTEFWPVRVMSHALAGLHW